MLAPNLDGPPELNAARRAKWWQYFNMTHAGVDSTLLHYLRAVAAAGTDDGAPVIAKMKELPTNDPLCGDGKLHAGGRKIRPMYLYQVETICDIMETDGAKGGLNAVLEAKNALLKGEHSVQTNPGNIVARPCRILQTSNTPQGEKRPTS